MPNDQSHPGSKDHAFLVLDGLRGVAAISVVIYHYIGQMTNYANQWPPNAWLAVDFFFVLSGFVVAYAYERKLLTGEKAGTFMLRRLIRLYPLFFIGMTLLPLEILVTYAFTGASCPYATFLIPYGFGLSLLPTPHSLLPTCFVLSISNIAIFPLDTPAWTLSLEIAINFVYALLCRHLGRTRLWVLAFIAAIGLAAAIWHYSNPSGWDWPNYLGGWARVIWSFFAGVLLCRLYLGKPRKKLPPWMGGLLAIILLAIFICGRPNNYFTFIDCLIVFPGLVWIGAKTGIWEKARGIYAWLGKTSYAVYIIHLPLFPLFSFLFGHTSLPDRSATLTAIIYAALALFIATTLDIIYDTPLRAYLVRKLLAGRRDYAINTAPSTVKEGSS